MLLLSDGLGCACVHVCVVCLVPRGGATGIRVIVIVIVGRDDLMIVGQDDLVRAIAIGRGTGTGTGTGVEIVKG